MAVSPGENNFYAVWRRQNASGQLLQEADRPFPESFLQTIWHHQRLLRDQLKTLDGKPVRVLHPGFRNREAGPDFRRAVVKVGNDEIKDGDVEIDLRSAGWCEHGHDTNPNFAKVILHVVWETDDHHAKVPAPTLGVKDLLDAPFDELTSWLGTESAKSWPDDLVGKCCAPLCELTQEKLDKLLHHAALIRLQRKANELQCRARQAGWEQSLWEGIFRALGYKQNVWPMQRLAELLPQMRAKNLPASFWQSWLLGVSGLLPSQPKENNEFLKSIWDIWWRERDSVSEHAFPKTLWRFYGMRPANFPERRIALVSHWLADQSFFQKLEQWFTQDDAAKMESSLLELLQVKEDSHWSWHWTFHSARLPQPQPLIGMARVSDLAMNVILPWFWIRAVAGKNELLRRRAEEIYFDWSAGEDNSVLRLARHRLLNGAGPKKLRTGAAQQGLLQIVRDFCEHSNAICEQCRFPDLVRSWSQNAVAVKTFP